jgi:hypothetical protein
MKTFDVDQLDLVSVLFNAFFILLNQATLVGITLLSADGYRPIWLNLLACAVLLAFAIWTFSVWKNEGGTSAFRFAAQINVRCLLTLAGLAFLSVCLAVG